MEKMKQIVNTIMTVAGVFIVLVAFFMILTAMNGIDHYQRMIEDYNTTIKEYHDNGWYELEQLLIDQSSDNIEQHNEEIQKRESIWIPIFIVLFMIGLLLIGIAVYRVVKKELKK